VAVQGGYLQLRLQKRLPVVTLPLPTLLLLHLGLDLGRPVENHGRTRLTTPVGGAGWNWQKPTGIAHQKGRCREGICLSQKRKGKEKKKKKTKKGKKKNKKQEIKKSK